MNNDVDILTRIEATANRLTKAETKVAQYVLRHPQEVLYTSITDLADICGVGDTTVFRFCKTLSLDGYQEFKMQLAQTLSSSQSLIDGISNEFELSDSLQDVAKKTLHASTSALSKTYDLIDYTIISKAMDFLIESERVLFCGVGSSLITALEAANKFMRISPKFLCNIDSHLQAMAAALLSPRDVLVAISFSGATKDIVEICRNAKKQGTTVIAITRFMNSPLTPHADIVMLCGTNEGPLQGGSMSGKIAQLYLLDVLFTEYFKRTHTLSDRNNKRVAASVLKKLY